MRLCVSPGAKAQLPCGQNFILGRNMTVSHISAQHAARSVICRDGSAEGFQGPEGGDDIEQQRQMLTRLTASSSMSGEELRALVLEKWNRPYDVRLQKRGARMYLHIMWKYLGQKSFRLTEEEYNMQLDAVAEYITMWGAAETVRSGIESATWAPGYTIGGGARAFQIPLNVNLENRGSEFEGF